MRLSRAFLESLIFGREGRRFTQDSPVLPDVWIHFGDRPDTCLDLLLTPHKDSSPGGLVLAVQRRLTDDRRRRLRGPDGNLRKAPNVAYNGAFTAARLYLDDIVRCLLPLTEWWSTFIVEELAEMDLADPASGPVPTLDVLLESRRGAVAGALRRLRRLRDGQLVPLEPGAPALPMDVVWMIEVVGHLAWAMQRPSDDGPDTVRLCHPDDGAACAEPPTEKEVIDAVVEILRGVPLLPAVGRGDAPPLFLVNRNRPVETAISRSILAVKADAGRQLFRIRCDQIRWAVVDSGIDALHPAFVPPADDGEAEDGPETRLRRSRIRRTYDFSRVRHLLDPFSLYPTNPELPDWLRAFLRADDDDRVAAARKEEFEDLRRHLASGRSVDWDLLEPFLRLPAQDYASERRPQSEHGTHVAGILGGNWEERDLVGMCPDIELFDFRVLEPGASNDEFPVLAALQFIRHLNSQSEVPVVHGVNLSLSLLHDVANYACGRTPICEECERLVASGVVVVVAAGNSGHLRYLTESGGAHAPVDGYHTVSITDPGNADGVITVGATHRTHPHTYGVSYFSSRGPTGDGRLKPDLVAPGEKITAPIPFEGRRRKDGTSMAAPHVSGAAALLMARHQELVGKPRRIKQILCDTATDLGRERYFQGAGMLDLLRALQSV